MGWSFIGNVVIHCAGEVWNEKDQRMEGTHRELGDFYGRLLGIAEWNRPAGLHLSQ